MIYIKIYFQECIDPCVDIYPLMYLAEAPAKSDNKAFFSYLSYYYC